jgi:hypothetical protein
LAVFLRPTLDGAHSRHSSERRPAARVCDSGVAVGGIGFCLSMRWCSARLFPADSGTWRSASRAVDGPPSCCILRGQPPV